MKVLEIKEMKNEKLLTIIECKKWLNKFWKERFIIFSILRWAYSRRHLTIRMCNYSTLRKGSVEKDAEDISDEEHISNNAADCCKRGKYFLRQASCES